MLSLEIFNSEFVGFIAEHFGIKLDNPKILNGYYESFSQIPDKRFEQVMSAAFKECDRFGFSVKWALERSREIAYHESLSESPVMCLPSELDRITDEQALKNRMRVVELSRSIGRGAKGLESIDRHPTPLEIAMIEERGHAI